MTRSESKRETLCALGATPVVADALDPEQVARAVAQASPEAIIHELTARARRQVVERRPQSAASREQRDELARRFFAAAHQGDLGALEALLAQDVVLHGDGGGKAPALGRPLHGRSRVARTLLAWARQGLRVSGAVLHQVEVNGQPGALLVDGTGKLIGVMALDIAGGQVQAVRAIVNPDKLRHIGPTGDQRRILEREEGG